MIKIVEDGKIIDNAKEEIIVCQANCRKITDETIELIKEIFHDYEFDVILYRFPPNYLLNKG